MDRHQLMQANSSMEPPRQLGQWQVVAQTPAVVPNAELVVVLKDGILTCLCLDRSMLF